MARQSAHGGDRVAGGARGAHQRRGGGCHGCGYRLCMGEGEGLIRVRVKGIRDYI